MGVGACVGTQGGSYFEARPEGDRLLFAIIEPGPNSAPDYNKVQKPLFGRQTSESGVSDPAAVGPPPLGSAGPGVQPVGLSGNRVSDPSWSFAFTAPSGWQQQKSDQGAILRHDTIPGLILVLPHEAPNLPELQWSMQQGFQDQNIGLMLAGGLEQVGNNTIAGNYNGIAQGSPVQARWIGVLESQGCRAYVIAIAPRQVYGKALTTAAETVVRSLRGVQRDASDLVAHFAGTWVTKTVASDNNPVVINDPRLTERMLPSLALVAGNGGVRQIPYVTGAEDFAYYAEQVPSLFFFVGSTPPGIDPAQAPSNHSPPFFLDEASLPVGLRALLGVAVDYLQGTQR